MTELPEHEDFGDYGRWPGRAVLDPTGRHLGEVREIYLDDATDRPEWVLVDLEGEAPRFVPLADATVEPTTRSASPKSPTASRPRPPSSRRRSSRRRRSGDLYSHYGLRYSEEESDSLLPDPDQPSGDERAAADATEAAGTPGVPPLAAAAAAEPAPSGRALRRFQSPEPAPEAAPPEPPSRRRERAPEALVARRPARRRSPRTRARWCRRGRSPWRRRGPSRSAAGRSGSCESGRFP